MPFPVIYWRVDLVRRMTTYSFAEKEKLRSSSIVVGVIRDAQVVIFVIWKCNIEAIWPASRFCAGFDRGDSSTCIIPSSEMDYSAWVILILGHHLWHGSAPYKIRNFRSFLCRATQTMRTRTARGYFCSSTSMGHVTLKWLPQFLYLVRV